MKHLKAKLFYSLILSLYILPHINIANAYQYGDIIKGPISGDVLQVIDGDTLTVNIHVWLGQNIQTKLRIDGIDTPEIHGKCLSEKARAQKAKQIVIDLVKNNKIEVYNIRNGKYAGRVLAKVKTSDGIDIGSYMIKKGLARSYHGKKRQGWCKT